MTPDTPKYVFPPVWSKCQCVFTSRSTGRIVVLKIASLSSLILEASPLSINSVLPSSTIAVTFPPSPEKTYNPGLNEVIVRGLSSNCSVAFWMTVSPVLACPIACEANPIIIRTRTTRCVRRNKAGLFRTFTLISPLSKGLDRSSDLLSRAESAKELKRNCRAPS